MLDATYSLKNALNDDSVATKKDDAKHSGDEEYSEYESLSGMGIIYTNLRRRIHRLSLSDGKKKD